MFIIKVEHTAAYRIIRFQATLMLATIDAPLNERNGRVLMMVLLLYHNGAAKIGTSLQSDSCVCHSAALKLSDYFRMIYNSLDEDEMLRKLRKFAR
ncbi:unnamed protein product [Brassica rapa]|uniref:Uncharacterized protein n=2 Tax=Brassica TaxID=3705 RepID=A0A8D9GSZ8_BRACM|nr:unnamed protein product [Brassica napus]CAG7885846.1 unnamed protein product [Brassica rapa]